MKGRLTPKQQMFAKEYIIDLNGTQAAIRSGCSPKTANRTASKWLSKVDIQKAIQKAMDERSKRVEFSADSTLRELKNIVHFNIKSIFNSDGSLKRITDLDDDTAAAVNGVEFTSKMDGEDVVRVTKIRINDKNKAIESAMKHFGLYEQDNKQRDEDININVTFQGLDGD